MANATGDSARPLTRADSWSLDPNRASGPLSFDELGLRVTGPAEGIKAPDRRGRSDIDELLNSALASGSDDETGAGEVASYGLAAMAERFER